MADGRLAVRLGLNNINGMVKEAAWRIEEARAAAPSKTRAMRGYEGPGVGQCPGDADGQPAHGHVGCRGERAGAGFDARDDHCRTRAGAGAAHGSR
nr:hypothetical protein [Janthinobacterium sp. BJB301]